MFLSADQPSAAATHRGAGTDDAMLTTLATASYRSLHELAVPLRRLNVITGANGAESRLRQLENEHGRLKRLVATLALDSPALEGLAVRRHAVRAAMNDYGLSERRSCALQASESCAVIDRSVRRGVSNTDSVMSRER